MTQAWSALRQPLTGIFGSTARVAAVRELALYGGMLSAPQLVARTRMSQSSVREALILLVEARVVNLHGAGKNVLYSLNAEHPLHIPIVRLFEVEAARFNLLIDELAKIGSEYSNQIDAIWMFGSVARRSDEFGSDLDLVFVTPESELPTQIREQVEKIGMESMALPSVTTLRRDDLAGMADASAPLIEDLLVDGRVVFGPRPVDMVRSVRAAQTASS